MLDKNSAGITTKQINTTFRWLVIITISVVFICLIITFSASHYIQQVSNQSQITHKNQSLITGVLVFLGLAVVVNTYFSAKRTQAIQQEAIAAEKNLALRMENTKLTQNRLISESFISAITQLGHEKVETRTGAIYALERVAEDFPQEYRTVMEILTAFIRENALFPPEQKQQKPEDETKAEIVKHGDHNRRLQPTDFHIQSESWRLRTDIQAALTVIGRRNHHYDQENKKLDLRHTNIRGANLPGAKLQRIDFRGADLSGADLRESDLNAANLDGTKLVGAILYGANLCKSSLRSANLSWANLNRANLSGVNLRAANLFAASLRSANLQGANLYKANLEKATLKAANLSGAKLFLANLQAAKLGKANLYSAGLIGANLQKANLNGANLQSANLNAAKLQQTDMYFADLSGASLKEADMSQANLMGTNLCETTLNEADLSWANLNGANLNGAQLGNVKLAGAILTGAKNLSSPQILLALGDRTTRLPDYLETPINWRQSS